MINLRAMNGKKFILNAEHIEKIENVPETLITLINGKKYIVIEESEEVVQKVIEYKNKIFYFKD